MDTNICNSRIHRLRERMTELALDAYVIPSSDYHQSEYVADFFKEGRYLSGFTGSNITMVITQQEALLWTDGRYFIQAEKELKGTSVKLCKMFEEGVPTVEEYLTEHIPTFASVGFDGKIMEADFACRLEKIFLKKQIKIQYHTNLIDDIWNDRPKFPQNPGFLLDSMYTGCTISQRIERIRQHMLKEGCSVHILCSLDDIAWLYQIRGKDIPNNPVVFSYGMITKKEAFLFIGQGVLTDKEQKKLKSEGVTLKKYEDIYSDIQRLKEEIILLDKNSINYYIFKTLSEHNTIHSGLNPEKLYKAVKNEVEIANTKDAHVKDGIAFTKFLYWLFQELDNKESTEITEISVSKRLEEFRKEQKGYLEPSFDTICAYQENAASMHYTATKTSNKSIKPEGFLLIDSGGQYIAGTTDITRTICMGPVSKIQKRHYTLVLKGMLRLSHAVFLHGCTGRNLDILAREALWREHLDYKCGTGHGVGYLLNVHEGPNTFRWRSIKKNDDAILEEGMITTNEPGIYLEGEYGIRIENELLCRKCIYNEYGQFMCFETITYAPIDIKAVDFDLLTKEESEWLLEYQRQVFDKITPYLNKDESIWLTSYIQN